MKGLICYDTRYGSTDQICLAIKRGMGIEVDIKNVQKVSRFDYDIIVIGSPIFIGKPLTTVADFLMKSKADLAGKNIAIFVSCWAAATEYKSAAAEFLAMMTKELPLCTVLAKRALPGRLLLDEITEQDLKALYRIIRRVANISEEFARKEIHWKDARNIEAAEEFGIDIITAYKRKEQKLLGETYYED